MGLRLGVWGFGFRVLGLRPGFWGPSGYRAQDISLGLLGLNFGV